MNIDYDNDNDNDNDDSDDNETERVPEWPSIRLCGGTLG
jgi:hypothetical protein